MTTWIPLFRVEPFLGSATEGIDAVVKCRRVVQVIHTPTPTHPGLWFCARVPVPKTAQAKLDAITPTKAPK